MELTFIAIDVLIKNKDKYLSEFNEDDDQGKIHTIINLFYAIATCSPKINRSETFKIGENHKELFVNYEYEFMDMMQF